MMSITSNPPAPDTGEKHEHLADLETCLALVNTLELADGVPAEGLPSAAEALEWVEQQGLGHAGPIAAQAKRDGDAWLARIHAVRGALRETWDAIVDGRTPGAPAIATLNAALERMPAPALHADRAAVLVGHRHHADDPTGEVLARLALPLVEAIASGDTMRFRVCANEGCRWVFEDTSRSGRRRWCDMTTCGNRAKVRRFRSRHRDARVPGADGAEDHAPGA
jgi:predicted RNA-binding Zn ribbon-like protein